MPLAAEGIRILDFTDGVSGPFCSMLLAGCGAEVIRIESLRHLGFRGDNSGSSPLVNKTSTLATVDVSQLITPNFARYHLDKLSITLNLMKPEARQILMKLVSKSDVVIDNLSFGVMKDWGLDYERLRQAKEDIIAISLPALGEGPHERWTTWGMNLLSFTGFANSWGHPDTPMEQRASSNTYADYVAGTLAAASILAALYHRGKTGEGQSIELSQTDSTLALLGLVYLDHFINHRAPQPLGNRHPQFAPHNCYRCKGEDRWCAVAISNEDEWQKLCAVLGRPDWVRDPRFATMQDRLRNVEQLDADIEAWTSQRTPHQVMKLLQTAGVPAGAVQNSEDMYHDIQLRSMGYMTEVKVGNRGTMTFDGPPVLLSDGQKVGTDGPPLLGAHNEYVYRQLLGMSQGQVEQLIRDKVIY
jgi:crotonobetainyl-CoA:carnitine CoA-transferase CaiB-like acyl-CoA transferase